MKQKLIAGLASAALIAAGSLSHNFNDADEQNTKDESFGFNYSTTDIHSVDSSVTNIFGYEVKGFDITDTERSTIPFYSVSGEHLGNLVLDCGVCRTYSDGVYSDVFINKLWMYSVSDGYLNAAGIEIIPNSPDTLKLVDYFPTNDGGTDFTNIQVGIGINSKEGLSISAGTSKDYDTTSMERVAVSDIAKSYFGVVYLFNPPENVWSSTRRAMHNQCRNTCETSAVSFDSQKREYDLTIKLQLSIGEEKEFSPVEIKMHIGAEGDCMIVNEISPSTVSDAITQDGLMNEFVKIIDNSIAEATSEIPNDEYKEDCAKSREEKEEIVPAPQQEDTPIHNDWTDEHDIADTAPVITPPQEENTPVHDNLTDAPDTVDIAPAPEQPQNTPFEETVSDVMNDLVDALQSDTLETSAAFVCHKDYYLVPCSNPDVAITAGGTTNKSSITVEKLKLGSDLQKWHFESAEDGSYYIVNSSTNYVIDMKVNDVSEIVDFKKTWLYEYQTEETLSKTQRFSIEVVDDDGKLSFKVAYNPGYCLDVYGDVTSIGNHIQLYSVSNGHTNNTQLFWLIEA